MIFDLINNIVFNFDGIYSPGKIDDSEGRFQITRASALKPFMPQSLCFTMVRFIFVLLTISVLTVTVKGK